MPDASAIAGCATAQPALFCRPDAIAHPPLACNQSPRCMHLTGMNTLFASTAERSRPYRIVGVAAVLMAAVAIGVMFAVNASRPQPTGALPVGSVASPSASSGQPSASPLPTSSPTSAVVADSFAFNCSATNLTANGSPATSFVDALRAGSHVGYDRVTVEFKNGMAGSVLIRPQAGTTFNQSPSGMAVKVAGRHGILVTIRGADAHTAYSGARDIKTSYPGLAEVRVLEDFEGQVSLGLGVNQSACYRASFLANPARLVIDVRN